MSNPFDTREKKRRERIEKIRSRVVEWAPAVLRALVACVCAAALAAQVGSPFLQFTCGFMAMLGMVAGQRLGRTPVRSAVLLPSLALAAFMSWWMSGLVTGSSVVVSMLTPGGALGTASVMRLGLAVLAVSTGLRAMATRQPLWAVVELSAMTAAVAALFASHRDGVVVRPLWFSDAAAAMGVEPTQALMAVGGGLAVALAVLLVVETRRRMSLATWIALPAVALLAFFLFRVSDLPSPDDENDLGLTDRTDSDEFNLDDEGMPENGGGQPEEQQGEQGSSEADAGDGESGGGEPDAGDAESGGGAGSDAGDAESGGGAGSDAGDAESGGGAGSDAGDAETGGGAGSDAGDAESGGSSSSQQESDGSSGGSSSEPPPDQQDQQSSSSPPPPQPPDFDSSPPNPSNPSPMAIVVLGDDYEPPMQSYYFRQESWSDFNGTRLVPSRAGYDADGIDRFPMLATAVQEPPVPSAERTMVRYTVAMLQEHSRPLALETPLRFIPAINPDPARFRRAYNAESLAMTVDYAALPGRVLDNPTWDALERAHYTEIPEDMRYAELAQEIINELPETARQDRFTQALAIKLWLDRNLIYSTQHEHANSRDPAGDFLFGDRIGYCVHIAHAAVFLWRSVGIPSRISSGYMVPAENRRGSNVLLTSSDAHAWPELWVDGLGWVILDVSPEQVLDNPVPPTDEELTEQLGEMARQEPTNPQREGSAEAPERPSLWSILWLQLFWTFVLGLIGLYVVKLWRRLAPWALSPAAQPHVAYRRVLDELAEAGILRPKGMSREAWAQSLRTQFPSLVRLTAMHNEARFGAAPVFDANSRRRWLDGLKAFETEIEQAVPLRKRLIYVLNPISFLFTR
jgi:protein-glutamine gamma-glutamyltransferase